MSYIVSNRRRSDDNRMGYTVEPFHVPNLMLPHLVLPDRITLLLLMDNKIREGHNHIHWRKILNRHRRCGNGLDIVVLPQNPLRQVTEHHVPAGHDPSRVLAYVTKRCHIPPRLVLPPDDISTLHQINYASVVFRINIAHERFPFTHKRVNTLIL